MNTLHSQVNYRHTEHWSVSTDTSDKLRPRNKVVKVSHLVCFKLCICSCLSDYVVLLQRLRVAFKRPIENWHRCRKVRWQVAVRGAVSQISKVARFLEFD